MNLHLLILDRGSYITSIARTSPKKTGALIDSENCVSYEILYLNNIDLFYCPVATWLEIFVKFNKRGGRGVVVQNFKKSVKIHNE